MSELRYPFVLRYIRTGTSGPVLRRSYPTADARNAAADRLEARGHSVGKIFGRSRSSR